MVTLIKNVNIVTLNGVIENGALAFEGEKITYVGKEKIETDRVIDGCGGYLLPGFVDVHCHGGGGFDFVDATPDEILKIADFHLSYGTTTLYATLPTTSIDELYSALENYREFDKKYSNTTVAGLHLEGPWFNPAQCGAQDTSNMLTPNPIFLRELKNKYPFIKHVAAAPELENGYEFGNTGKELGIVMSAGHTDASFSEIERAFESGYTGMTHLYSGMKGVTRKNSFRIAGAVEGGLYIDGMFVEIIADGRHLPYELLRFIFKFKGEDKIMLVTDATRAAGLPNGTESVVGSLANGTPIIIEDEVAKLHDRQSFAGSIATADRLFRTMAEAIGKNWVALMKMSSYVPAHFMGLDDRGEIAVGKLADLVIIDENCNLKKVIKGGIEADVRSTQ